MKTIVEILADALAEIEKLPSYIREIFDQNRQSRLMADEQEKTTIDAEWLAKAAKKTAGLGEIGQDVNASTPKTPQHIQNGWLCPDCGEKLDTRRMRQSPRLWVCRPGCGAAFRHYENGTWDRVK